MCVGARKAPKTAKQCMAGAYCLELMGSLGLEVTSAVPALTPSPGGVAPVSQQVVQGLIAPKEGDSSCCSSFVLSEPCALLPAMCRCWRPGFVFLSQPMGLWLLSPAPSWVSATWRFTDFALAGLQSFVACLHIHWVWESFPSVFFKCSAMINATFMHCLLLDFKQERSSREVRKLRWPFGRHFLARCFLWGEVKGKVFLLCCPYELFLALGN